MVEANGKTMSTKTNGTSSSSSSKSNDNGHHNVDRKQGPASSGVVPAEAAAVTTGGGGCQWIPWESDYVRGGQVPDPTRVFSLLVIGIMMVRYLAAHDWRVSLLFTGFLLHPAVVVSFATSAAVLYGSAPSEEERKRNGWTPLPSYDRWTVEWYWWNAWLYHMTMDGASGSLRLVPVVVHQYDQLDRRFATHHVVPWIIGMIELFVMAPLCLFTVRAILRRDPNRFPLELVTSTLQFMGMIVFVAAEVYEGQTNVPALDPVGNGVSSWANVKLLDMYHLTYYWFGFWFCNLVWGVVPYYRIDRAWRECSQAMSLTAAAAAANSSSSSSSSSLALKLVKDE